MRLAPLSATYGDTRNALHALAEHVVCVARYVATGRIGLRPAPGGFGTPAYGDDQQVQVRGVEVVSRRGREEVRAPITTLRAAAEFVGVPLGAPTEVFAPTTAADPDRPLPVDATSATALAQWYALVGRALAELTTVHATHSPSEAQLWPEHFDLALELGDADMGTRANYGASPGDDALPHPYLYVGPWDAARRTGRFAACGWGAALHYADLVVADDPVAAAVAFYRDSAAELLSA